MTLRITTSEPAYRAPLSQADRIRMGRVQPMEHATLYIGGRELWHLCCVVVFFVVVLVALV